MAIFRGSDHQHALIHEAAHAVIGDVLDVPIYHIQIGPGPGSAGMEVDGFVMRMRSDVIIDHWHENPYLQHRSRTDALHASIILLMAAAEAENIMFDEPAYGDGSDREKIALLYDQLGYRDEVKLRWEVRLRRHTRTLVRRHIPQILYVWKYLQRLRYPIVAGEELKELLRRAKMYG